MHADRANRDSRRWSFMAKLSFATWVAARGETLHHDRNTLRCTRGPRRRPGGEDHREAAVDPARGPLLVDLHGAGDRHAGAAIPGLPADGEVGSNDARGPRRPDRRDGVLVRDRHPGRGEGRRGTELGAMAIPCALRAWNGPDPSHVRDDAEDAPVPRGGADRGG